METMRQRPVNEDFGFALSHSSAPLMSRLRPAFSLLGCEV